MYNKAIVAVVGALVQVAVVMGVIGEAQAQSIAESAIPILTAIGVYFFPNTQSAGTE